MFSIELDFFTAVLQQNLLIDQRMLVIVRHPIFLSLETPKF